MSGINTENQLQTMSNQIFDVVRKTFSSVSEKNLSFNFDIKKYEKQLFGIAIVAGSVIASYVGYRTVLSFLEAKSTKKVKVPEKEKLSEYELQIVKDLILNTDMKSGFENVGGLDTQIEEIQELVIFPLRYPHLYAHSAVAQQPTGCLLYGPPGTGKTMLAKAIAASAEASFLHVNIAEGE
jgi:ATPase family AAA domain-containing protein 1